MFNTDIYISFSKYYIHLKLKNYQSCNSNINSLCMCMLNKVLGLQRIKKRYACTVKLFFPLFDLNHYLKFNRKI